MKSYGIFFALACLALACGGSPDSDAGQGTTSGAQRTTTTAAADGEKIYKQYCVTCHGVYGNMGASGAHDLTASALSLDERIAVVTAGRNLMTGFKALLSEDKIKAVSEYTFQLKVEE
jgi:mono/diheme cytochrome c family protein